MRDYGEEPSLLYRAARAPGAIRRADHLQRQGVRPAAARNALPHVPARRAAHPFDRMQHLDLLFGARRLWKLRLDSCRLVDLENQVLGVEREGDLPGEMIPYCYFEFLRTQQAFKVVPIFHHNAIDILSLACLTAIVPVRVPASRRRALAAWRGFAGAGALAAARPTASEEALRLFRRAIDLGLPDACCFAPVGHRGDGETRSAGRCGAGDDHGTGGIAESRTGCARWKRSRSTTSIASGTTRWRWR